MIDTNTLNFAINMTPWAMQGYMEKDLYDEWVVFDGNCSVPAVSYIRFLTMKLRAAQGKRASASKL
jgi:hypothetical protein